MDKNNQCMSLYNIRHCREKRPVQLKHTDTGEHFFNAAMIIVQASPDLMCVLTVHVKRQSILATLFHKLPCERLEGRAQFYNMWFYQVALTGKLLFIHSLLFILCHWRHLYKLLWTRGGVHPGKALVNRRANT